MAKLFEMLRCPGHYGYGSGWTKAEFCLRCEKSQVCLNTMRAGLEGRDEDLEVAENRLNGGGDRIEGVSRYVNVVTIRSITRHGKGTPGDRAPSPLG